MDCISPWIAALLVGLTLGCSSGSTDDPAAETGPDASAQSAASLPTPVDVVSRFLDEIRRGGEGSQAQSLLTTKAQSELQRIGHTVQPIGSPDARFTVTRAQEVPGEANASLVHSLWSEPRADGTMVEYQVVWAVHQEAAGWRISGLAIEIDPNQSPQIIDFENGEMMAQLLTSEEPAVGSDAAPAQAAANSSISR